jgi:poly-gamma-glutamate synthesis protein (capsule biosynthesis protein)
MDDAYCLHFDAPDAAEWSLFVAGDAVLEGELASSPVATALAERVAGADCSLVNLEAPVRCDAAPAAKFGPTLDQHPDAPAALADAGFDAVTLANNHLMDYGTAGLEATQSACQAAALATVGAGADHDAALEPLVRSVAGVEVATVSVCEREFGVARDEEPGTAWQRHPTVTERIAAAAADCDVVVVVSHGGIESVPLPPPTRRERCRAFVDAGADAVVGHHPHVPQGWEVYDGAPILFSLGNFAFEMPDPASRWGLAAELRFGGDRIASIDLVPVELVDGTVSALGLRRDRDAHLAHIERLADITADEAAHLAHWQEMAEQAFLDRHSHTLRQGAGGTLEGLVAHPTAYVRQDGMWDAEARGAELRGLLNVLRNESHHDVVRTALELRTGETADRRTPAVRERARDLLERASQRPPHDRPHRATAIVRSALEKLHGDSRAALRGVANALSLR